MHQIKNLIVLVLITVCIITYHREAVDGCALLKFIFKVTVLKGKKDELHVTVVTEGINAVHYFPSVLIASQIRLNHAPCTNPFFDKSTFLAVAR
jgi:hypothetical protein